VERHQRATEGLPLHEFDSLRQHRASVLAGCTTRGGGVSRPPYDELNLGLHVGDDPGAVLKNRGRLAATLGVESSAFVFAQQVHGGGVRVVSVADRGRGACRFEDALPDTDALITRDAGVVLAVVHADCVPVVLFDPRTPAVGVVHAGWGGVVSHVVRNAVGAMRMEFASDPATLFAGIGPSIGPASYEVRVEVAERVQAECPYIPLIRPRSQAAHVPTAEQRAAANARGETAHPHAEPDERKYLLDLWKAAAADLMSAGVPRENIEMAGLDTFQLHPRFFSHRRRQPTGRCLTFAMLRA
jgi:purine-nucleoside/S-methyl-5'-thioadenosine phosphorylase / adenosine deaminase